MNNFKNTLKFTELIKLVQVIEPYKPQVIQFENIDDFNIYYTKHADDFKDITTYKLNVKYKIPGYKITRKSGELKLIKDYRSRGPPSDEVDYSNKDKMTESQTDNEELPILRQRIENVEQQIKTLTAQLTNINKYLESISEHFYNS